MTYEYLYDPNAPKAKGYINTNTTTINSETVRTYKSAPLSLSPTPPCHYCSNATAKQVDVTVKLRADGVYDLYLNGIWIASKGCCLNIAEEASKAIRSALLDEMVYPCPIT